MAQISIAIYAAKEANNHNPDIQQITRNYVDECFSATDYDRSYTIPNNYPDPPNENSLEKQDGTTCRDISTYNLLVGWFDDYVGCNNLPRPDDGILLVTNSNHGGGGQAGNVATVDGYWACADLSTSTTNNFACSRAHRDMAIAAQEAGHMFGLEHSHGFGYEDINVPSEWYSTPQFAGREEPLDEQENACGTYVGNFDKDQHDRCYEFNWSGCSENNITI